MSSDEFTALVSVTAAQAEAALPARVKSPRHLEQSEMSALLAQGLAEYQQ